MRLAGDRLRNRHLHRAPDVRALERSLPEFNPNGRRRGFAHVMQAERQTRRYGDGCYEGAQHRSVPDRRTQPTTTSDFAFPMPSGRCRVRLRVAAWDHITVTGEAAVWFDRSNPAFNGLWMGRPNASS